MENNDNDVLDQLSEFYEVQLMKKAKRNIKSFNKKIEILKRMKQS